MTSLVGWPRNLYTGPGVAWNAQVAECSHRPEAAECIQARWWKCRGPGGGMYGGGGLGGGMYSGPGGGLYSGQVADCIQAQVAGLYSGPGGGLYSGPGGGTASRPR